MSKERVSEPSALAEQEVRPGIGIITALPHEYTAVKVLLESRRPIFVSGRGAGRQYLYGEMPAPDGGRHRIVLALLPDTGNNQASARATLLLEHFPSVHTIIMSGIAGGIPDPNRPAEHVRLGDVVVSNREGVVQYDFGKEELENRGVRVTLRNPPRPPSARLIETARLLQAGELEGERPWVRYIDLALERLSVARPPASTDVVTSSTDPESVVAHPADARRVEGLPRIFLGPIASSNTLLKNPAKRDQLRESFGVKAVEMEGSGIADAAWVVEVQYIVIRGVCDYCNRNKGDEWQVYAAVVAAAYTRALLGGTPSGPVRTLQDEGAGPDVPTLGDELLSELGAYFETLSARAAELPAYYPDHLRAGEVGEARFDGIRQIVQVAEDGPTFVRWLAEERERLRAAGQEFDRIAYSPVRARPEAEEVFDWRGGRRPPPLAQPWDAHAGKRFRRAVVLGDPGFGKTWLLRYEARRLSNEAARQLREGPADLDKLTFPIFARFSDLNKSDGPVEDALVGMVCARGSNAFRRFVKEKLSSERCVILLDAWDEVPVEIPRGGQPVGYLPRHRQRLGQRLEDFARQFPKPRLLLTSRVVGYDSTQLSIPDLQQLELLAFDSAQTGSFVSAWFGDEARSAKRFLAMLRQSPQVRGLARIPLMLTLLGRTYVECQNRGQGFPTRRAEIYGRCLYGLLRDWKREKGQWIVSAAYVDAVLELLYAVSYTFLVEGFEQFDESNLRRQIIRWRSGLKYKHELDDDDPTSIIDKLKRDGILIAAGEQPGAPLLFLHRTFQEYSAACALAQKSDWLAEALSHVYDPNWQEVLRLLGGLVKGGAESYVKALVVENDNDLLWRPLRAAVFAAVEADPDHLTAQLSESLLKQAVEAYCRPPNLLLTRESLRPLVTCWGRRAVPLLALRLKDESAWVRSLAADALGEIGAVEAIAPMLPLLKDKDVSVHKAAARALGSIGAEAIPHLLPLLGDAHLSVRKGAVEALGHVGSGEVLPRLLPLLGDDDEVRRAVAGALGMIGSPEAVPHLLPLLDDDEDWYLRQEAVEALGKMGAPEVVPHLLRQVDLSNPQVEGNLGMWMTWLDALSSLRSPEVIPHLLPLLADDDPVVRRAAVEELRDIGGPGVVPHLLPLLRDADAELSRKAGWGVGENASPEVVPHLLPLLKDGYWGARRAAVEALKKLEPFDAVPHLLPLQKDEDSEVRRAAAAGLRQDETSKDVRQILPLLDDEDTQVRVNAVHALGTAGRDAIPHLLPLLGDENSSVRYAAVYTFQKIGSAEVIPHLLPLLEERAEYGVRRMAARAVAAFESPPNIPRLLLLLKDKDWEVCETAARALVKSEPPDLIPILLSLLGEPAPKVRDVAVEGIVNKGAEAVPHLLPLLTNADGELRRKAASILGEIGSAEAVPHLIRQLTDTHLGSGHTAAVALAKIGRRHKIPLKMPRA